MSVNLRTRLQGSWLSGLTTALVLIPQSMAYAALAGVPPAYGLYASVMPLLVYAWLGRSPVLAVGPVALDSLVLAGGVALLAPLGTEQAASMASLITLLAGVMLIVLGFLRASAVLQFLAQPVVQGFMSAAALVITYQQIGPLLGLRLPRISTVLELWNTRLQGPTLWHVPTLVIGVGSLLSIRWLDHVLRGKRWSGAAGISVVVVVTVLAYAAGYDGATVGAVVLHPGWQVPDITVSEAIELFPTVGTLAMLAMLEAVAVQKNYHPESVKVRQEFFAIGGANIASALSGGIAVTGGLSRTAVAVRAGARSRMSGVVTAVMVAVLAMAGASLLSAVPVAALAALVIAAAVNLFKPLEVRRIWRIRRSDIAMWIVTFAGTLILGVSWGILFGVAVSILIIQIRQSRPQIVVLGLIPNSRDFRNVQHYPEARTFPGLVMVRMDAHFYFANMEYLRTALETIEAKSTTPIHTILIDASSMTDLDSTAADTLLSIQSRYLERGIRVAYAHVKQPVLEIMTAAGLYAVAGPDNFYFNLYDALGTMGYSEVCDPPRPKPRGQLGSHAMSVQTISAETATRMVDSGAYLLDVRTQAEHAAGCIPGTHGQADWHQWTTSFPALKHAPAKDQPIVVYCHMGGRSAAAAGWLASQGYSHVHNLAGGFARWTQEGRPCN